MRSLLRFLKKYKKESIIAPLFKFTEACFELIVPIVMSRIIDIGIKNSDTGYIVRMGLVMVLLGLLGLVCSLTAQYFAAKAALGFGTELRSAAFRHISGFTHAELDSIGTSTLITRMTGDINQVQTGVNMFLRLFMRSPFIVLGALVMAFTINPGLSLIFVVATPIIGLIIYIVMTRTIPMFKDIQKRVDRVALLSKENLAGARVVRAFRRQQEEQREFHDAADELLIYQKRAGRLSALQSPFTYVVVNFAILAIIWFGGAGVYKGELTQGEVTALISYMSQILLALVAFANLISILTKATASASRVEEVFEVSPSIASPEDSIVLERIEGIEFKQVSFAYKNAEEHALKNISFRVSAGTTVGIIGGTGSGKSTLVNLIPRFYDITGGELLVNDKPVTAYSLKSLRSRIGIVPQKAVLFRGTIRDNMRYGHSGATDEEIWEALRRSQASDFVEKKPEGLDTMVVQGSKNLSGGQRQRLTIARALVGDPDVLILDDSASALDFATDAALRRELAKTFGSRIVFIISQRASAIRSADIILVLDDGEIVGMGTHKQLIKECGVYHEICSSQHVED